MYSEMFGVFQQGVQSCVCVCLQSFLCVWNIIYLYTAMNMFRHLAHVRTTSPRTTVEHVWLNVCCWLVYF